MRHSEPSLSRANAKLPDKELAARFTEQRVEVSVAAVPKARKATSKLPDSVW